MKQFIAPLATFSAPVAPAISFGAEAYEWLHGLEVHQAFAVVGGVSIAAALEFVGYLAGHTAVDYWRSNDARWRFAALFLAAYAAIGIWHLGIETIGGTAFLIALLTYGISALHADASEQKAHAVADTQRGMDNEHEIKMRRLELAHAAKLAKISAESGTKVARKLRESSVATYTDWRKVPEVEREKIRKMSVDQIRETYGVSPRTALNWSKK